MPRAVLNTILQPLAQVGAPPAADRTGAVLVFVACGVLVAVAVAVTLLVVRRRGRRSRATPSEPSCGKCGYLVNGLTTFTCPECGSDLREVGIARGGGGLPGGPGLAFLKIVGWKLALVAALFTLASIGAIEYYADHYHQTHWQHTEEVKAVPRSKAFTSANVTLTERMTADGRPPYRGTPRPQFRQVTVELQVGSNRALFVRDCLDATSRYLDAGGVERSTRLPVAEVLRVWAANQGVDVKQPAAAAELDLIADAIGQANQPGGFWDVMANASRQRFDVKSAGAFNDPGLGDWYYVLSVGGAIVLGVGLLVIVWLRNRRRLGAALAEGAAFRPAAAGAAAAVDPEGAAQRDKSGGGGGGGASSPVVRTLSVMFSDVKDYTARAAQESRVGILDLVRRHRDLVQPIAKRRGGRIVKSMGDGLLLVFESATDAVLAGLEIQAAAVAHTRTAFAERDKVELRVAVSTGEVAQDEGDVFGESVNLASRAQQHAAAGEVLFTEATWGMINRREVACVEAGTFTLKGIDGPVRLFRAMPAGRAVDVQGMAGSSERAGG